MPSSAPSTAALPSQSRAARRRLPSFLRMGLLALTVGGCVASLAHQALQADARDLVPQQSMALPAAAQAVTLPSLTFKSSGAMPVQGRWLQFQRDLGAGTVAGRGMPPLAWQWGSQSGECQMAGPADAWRAQVMPSASAQLSCQAGNGQMALRLQQADPQGIRRWTGEIRLPGGQQFAVESLHELGGQARPEVRGYLIRQAGQPVAEVQLAAAGPVIRLGEGVAPMQAAQSLWPSLLNLALWSPPAPGQASAASS